VVLDTTPFTTGVMGQPAPVRDRAIGNRCVIDWSRVGLDQLICLLLSTGFTVEIGGIDIAVGRFFFLCHQDYGGCNCQGKDGSAKNILKMFFHYGSLIISARFVLFDAVLSNGLASRGYSRISRKA